MKYESDDDNNCNLCVQNDPQRFDKWVGRVGNRRTSRDHAYYNITEVGQNTANSPGDLKRLAVPQTPLKDSLLTLV